MGYANELYAHIQQDEAEPVVLVVTSRSGSFNNTGTANGARQPTLSESQ